MSHRVVITGTGALSPLGATPAALWRGLLDGRAGIRSVARLAGLEVTSGGEVGEIALDRIDRDEVIATRAIDDALRESGRDAATTGLLWGTALDTYTGAPMVHRSAGACFTTLAARFGSPRRMIAVACATGTAAIGEAFRLVREGRVQACVAGGSSVMLGRHYLFGFHALRAVAADVAGEPADRACKPFDRDRRGFALADGAGALVIESLESAGRRGVEPIAELVGYGSSQDAFDLNRPPADGGGAVLAMQRALSDSQLGPSAIEAVNAHGTGTHVGDIAEASAIQTVLGEHVPVSSLKGAIGHTMAAAGALEAIAAIATCRTGVVPPTRNLVHPDEACRLDHVIGAPRETGASCVVSVSFGMGGQNAAIILRRFVS
ncbi:MAG: beta-ketoacyl-[acyl-carrier-protein] synthase family protein [Deltaproteobacteria bacterium]|nr:beta-ketoacyl-[acyl-carrier-protein] synthase family protein [Deltaproteobacteria bacterium]